MPTLAIHPAPTTENAGSGVVKRQSFALSQHEVLANAGANARRMSALTGIDVTQSADLPESRTSAGNNMEMQVNVVEPSGKATGSNKRVSLMSHHDWMPLDEPPNIRESVGSVHASMEGAQSTMSTQSAETSRSSVASRQSVDMNEWLGRNCPSVVGRLEAYDSELKKPGMKCGCVINPEESPLLRRWDYGCSCALVYVCFVSPFEVAFLPVSPNIDVLFVVNRLIDLLFIGDIILQFFVAYPIKGRYSETYVCNQKRIILHYLRGWFLIDFISVLPYDLLGLVVGSNELASLKTLRVMRLFKLLKLVRLLRGLRIIKRWQMEFGVSYRKMMLWQLMFSVLIFSHWTGCILGIVNILQGGACFGDGHPGCSLTWASKALERSGVEYHENGEVPAGDAYLLALHTALTIIVHPHMQETTGKEENLIFSLLLLAGGFVWTRVISRSTAIATSLDRHKIYHQQTMDDLNAISQTIGLSAGLRRRLRAYFVMNREESQRKTFIELTYRMSPRLQSDVAHEMNRAWVMRVRYLFGCSRSMLTDVSQALITRFYAQMETFGSVFCLHILTRGLVSRGKSMRVLTPGAVWGEDQLILNNFLLLEDVSAIAVTFCEVLILERDQFQKILELYPEDTPRMRKEYIRMVFIQGVRWFANQKKREALETAAQLSSMNVLGSRRNRESDYEHSKKRLTRFHSDGGTEKPDMPAPPPTTGSTSSGPAAFKKEPTWIDRATEEEELAEAYRQRLRQQILLQHKEQAKEENESNEHKGQARDTVGNARFTQRDSDREDDLDFPTSSTKEHLEEAREELAEIQEKNEQLLEKMNELKEISMSRVSRLEESQKEIKDSLSSLTSEVKDLRENLGAQLTAISKALVSTGRMSEPSPSSVPAVTATSVSRERQFAREETQQDDGSACVGCAGSSTDAHMIDSSGTQEGVPDAHELS